jgi:hypothetical protein
MIKIRNTLALSKNGERNMGSRLKSAGTTGVVAASFARHSRSPLAGIQFFFIQLKCYQNPNIRISDLWSCGGALGARVLNGISGITIAKTIFL